MSYFGTPISSSASVNEKRYTYTATAGQTTFAVPGGFTVPLCDVFVNGIKMVNGADVNVSSGTSVILAIGTEAGDVVDIVAEQGSSAAVAPASSIMYSPAAGGDTVSVAAALDRISESTGVVTVQTEVQTATAGQTVFTLTTMTYQPATGSLTVYVDGVNQYEGVDYAFDETNGTTVTFSDGLHVGALVKFTTATQTTGNATDAAVVTYTPPFDGAVATTVEDELAQTVSVKDFGAKGDGITDDFNAMFAAWEYCHPIGASLYFPSGTYVVAGERSFPFNQGSGVVTALLDCYNMTIYGDGPSSILKTVSVNGSDVLQLNGLKNFHVRNLQVESVVTGSAAGSNGMSITGGFDNITVDNFWAKNLGFVGKADYVDGGKAVSIQPPGEGSTSVMGSFKATNVFADGCVYGFGYEPDNDKATVQPVSIDVDIVVSNSRQGVVISGTETTAAISANSTSGVRIRAQTINCMQDVVISRALGADVECQIVQTKTQAELLLSYEGAQWKASDDVADVIGVIVGYAKNSRIIVSGNKKTCRHKAKIGGAGDPNVGFAGNTNFCDFYFDITGTSDGVEVQFQDAGGNIMNNSRLYCTTSTALTLPVEFYDPALDNTLTIGPDVRLQSMDVTTRIGWTQEDGRTVRHEKYILSGNLSTRQTVGSGADLIVEQWLNHNQDRKLAVRNDGCLATAGKATAVSVATIKGVLPIYDQDNVLYGYVPVHTSYS